MPALSVQSDSDEAESTSDNLITKKERWTYIGLVGYALTVDT